MVSNDNDARTTRTALRCVTASTTTAAASVYAASRCTSVIYSSIASATFAAFGYWMIVISTAAATASIERSRRFTKLSCRYAIALTSFAFAVSGNTVTAVRATLTGSLA